MMEFVERGENTDYFLPYQQCFQNPFFCWGVGVAGVSLIARFSSVPMMDKSLDWAIMKSFSYKKESYSGSNDKLLLSILK